jgi:hypothetical protein
MHSSSMDRSQQSSRQLEVWPPQLVEQVDICRVYARCMWLLVLDCSPFSHLMLTLRLACSSFSSQAMLATRVERKVANRCCNTHHRQQTSA